MEEPVRATKRGKVRPAAMSHHRWRDERTLEITVRDGERFADGSGLDAESVQTEDRSPVVRLRANPHYWDRVRGPRLA